jgi:hypothetical protein
MILGPGEEAVLRLAHVVEAWLHDTRPARLYLDLEGTRKSRITVRIGSKFFYRTEGCPQDEVGT